MQSKNYFFIFTLIAPFFSSLFSMDPSLMQVTCGLPDPGIILGAGSSAGWPPGRLPGLLPRRVGSSLITYQRQLPIELINAYVETVPVIFPPGVQLLSAVNTAQRDVFLLMDNGQAIRSYTTRPSMDQLARDLDIFKKTRDVQLARQAELGINTPYQPRLPAHAKQQLSLFHQ